jgi:SAM-dependent methyltransferase
MGKTMSDHLPVEHWIAELLRCPDCGHTLNWSDTNWSCPACGFASLNERDLRAHLPSLMTISLARKASFDPQQWLLALPTSAPECTYRGPAALRDSTAFLSVMQEQLPYSARVLDLGCGPKDQKAPIEHLRHRYLGVDFDSQDADLLVDAHALPFQSQSFDCIFSYAVLEHLHNPFVAMTEVARVLKPGGLFLGTVSQGEPFHASYFHHTAWGLLSLLSQVPQLQPRRLWPAIDTLDSLASMGRYPKPIRQGLAALARLHAAVPQLAPRKARWPQKEREIDAIHRAGSIAFVIEKVVL